MENSTRYPEASRETLDFIAEITQHYQDESAPYRHDRYLLQQSQSRGYASASLTPYHREYLKDVHNIEANRQRHLDAESHVAQELNIDEGRVESLGWAVSEYVFQQAKQGSEEPMLDGAIVTNEAALPGYVLLSKLIEKNIKLSTERFYQSVVLTINPGDTVANIQSKLKKLRNDDMSAWLGIITQKELVTEI